ncbi:hypothetical protein OTU49_013405 [Cherax quadricarinatus]|uniref:Telomerase reverse transcriptase n=2 Tax=Cherax quadricarinatus TaxID=27406 RepID=A0AAW0VVJ4_CHEQU
MTNINLKDCKWASSLSNFRLKTNVIAKLFVWVMCRLVMVTLNSFFYLTEHAAYHNQLLYYRKRVWQQQHDRGLNALMNNDSLVRFSQEISQVVSPDEPRQNKFPRIRFIPKKQDVRPIMPLGRGGMSLSLLLKARVLLGHLSKAHMKGSMKTKSSSDLHNAWCMYTKKILVKENSNNRLYFVRTDIRDAYGSILHNKLVDLLQQCIENLAPTLAFGQYVSMRMGGKTGKKITYILLDGNKQPTTSLIRGAERLVEVYTPVIVQPQKVVEEIKQLLCKLIISNGSKLFRIVRGLPQGGSLSAALCEFYYAAMCAAYFCRFNHGSNVLFRAVDDFLFISEARRDAEQFMEHVKSGIPEFNCSMNKEKTLHNLDTQIEHRVSFCGIIVCLKSLQLLVNTSSLAIGYPKYTMRLNTYESPGKFVKERLRQVTLTRLQPLMLDPSYTKTNGVITNVWRSGFMAGARLLAMLSNVLAPRGKINAKFISLSVIEVGHKVYRRIQSVFQREDVNLTVPKVVILITYVTGVCTMMNWPGLPKWLPIYNNLRRFLKRMLVNVPGDMQRLLPTLLHDNPTR